MQGRQTIKDNTRQYSSNNNNNLNKAKQRKKKTIQNMRHKTRVIHTRQGKKTKQDKDKNKRRYRTKQEQIIKIR